MKKLWLILVLAALAYTLTAMTQVRPGERAVVRRFGRVVATPGPGLWIGLPWGFDRVERVPTDLVRRIAIGYQPETAEVAQESPPGQLLTGDHNLVNAQVVIHYEVDDPVSYMEQAERADEFIARAAESALAEWVAGRAIDDVLLHAKIDLPSALTSATQDRIAPYQLGVRVLDGEVAYLYPPEEVKNAFADVTRAQASMLTREHEARQEAARLLREAQTDRFRIEAETTAYVQETLRLARAEAERFEVRLAEYHRLRQSNPQFLQALWWQEVGQLLGQLQSAGRLDLLDHRLGRDGLDVTVSPPQPRKR